MPTINLTLPTDWSELTEAQLTYVIHLFAHGFSPDQVKLCLLMRLNHLQPTRSMGGHTWQFRHRGRTITADTTHLHATLAWLAWLDTPPTSPLRPTRLGRASAIDAHLHGVPFSTYLRLVNLYQGYIMSRNTEAVDHMAAILYPRLRPPRNTATLHTACIWWMAALMQHFAARFTHLFAPAPADGAATTEAASPERTMNAMLAALTAGDITKEAEVLSTDTWRALTYLDRMAEDAAKIK